MLCSLKTSLKVSNVPQNIFMLHQKTEADEFYSEYKHKKNILFLD